jgi:lauroyl/myristoyl acyltransferase
LLKQSPSIYWSSLAELITSTPTDKLDQFFPVNGLHNLTDAIARGKGVILLSFHGMMTPLRFLPLKWRIEKDITTISYQIALAQSRIRKHQTGVRAQRSTMNAELALYGHRILEEGGVINIIGDSSDPYGKDYRITLCGRAFRVMTGFAEMAINSGATVLPYFGRVLMDGTQETNILPPFEEAGTIDQMMQQYQDFVNHVWNNYPDAIRWAKIQNYYRQPKA